MKISLLFTFLLCTFSLSAGTGPSAFIFPAKNIRVDGVAEDWHNISEKYHLKANFGNSNSSSGYFKSAYNKESGQLYFLVVLSNKPEELYSKEIPSLYIYLDLIHRMDLGSRTLRLDFKGDSIDSFDSAKKWNSSDPALNLKHVISKSKAYPNKVIYEISLDLADIINGYTSFGLEVLSVATDSINGNRVFSSWGIGGSKEFMPFRLGNLLLLPKPEKMTQVSGLLQFQNHVNTNYPEQLLIYKVDKPSFWTATKVDSTGRYHFQLPAGDYALKTYGKVNNAHSFAEKSRLEERVELQFSLQEEDFKILDTFHLTKYKAPDFLLPEKGLLFSETLDVQKLDFLLEVYMDYYNVVGVQFIAIKNGNIAYSVEKGFSDKSIDKPLNNSSIFEIASISKVIFAIAVHRLAEQGVIDLDKPLKDYLPFDQLSDDKRANDISARHILSHQSGLPNWIWGGPFGFESGKKGSLLFEPGSDYQYSGEGYEYLKRVIEFITNRDVESIVREQVLIPFNMQHSSYLETSFGAELVVGHSEEDPMFWGLHDRAWVAGGLYSNAEDLANLIMGIMHQEHLSQNVYENLLSKESMDRSPFLLYFGGYEAGHTSGFEYVETELGRIIHHGGNNGDFQSRIAIDMQRQNGYVLLTNSNNGFKLDLKLQEILFTGFKQ
ncbi:MAG: serine hydrolase domain-containing protein [Bacteroidota bacterium]